MNRKDKEWILNKYKSIHLFLYEILDDSEVERWIQPFDKDNNYFGELSQLIAQKEGWG